ERSAEHLGADQDRGADDGDDVEPVDAAAFGHAGLLCEAQSLRIRLRDQVHSEAARPHELSQTSVTRLADREVRDGPRGPRHSLTRAKRRVESRARRVVAGMWPGEPRSRASPRRHSPTRWTG